MGDTKLLPCPWCGEELKTARVTEGSTFRWRKVDGCCADGPEIRHDTMADDQEAAEIDSRCRAIEAWNTRPALLAAAKYEEANPLGGPATMLEAAARRVRAGEDFHEALADYGLLARQEGESVFWHPGDQPPQAMTSDETGCTVSLVLVVQSPEDCGPNIRQGLYDHCLRGFFDSATAQRIDPDRWTFAPTPEAARSGGGGYEPATS